MNQFGSWLLNFQSSFPFASYPPLLALATGKQKRITYIFGTLHPDGRLGKNSSFLVLLYPTLAANLWLHLHIKYSLYLSSSFLCLSLLPSLLLQFCLLNNVHIFHKRKMHFYELSIDFVILKHYKNTMYRIYTVLFTIIKV